MRKLVRDLLTNKYTVVLCDDEKEQTYNAPHNFVVKRANHLYSCGNKECVYQFCPHKRSEQPKCSEYIPSSEETEEVLCRIHFQEGPIIECGVNGVCNEDLINMVIERLECFQKSEFNCRENALAIQHLEEALLWLRKRTMGREQRGVEGTHTV